MIAKKRILSVITLAGFFTGILAGVFFSLSHDLPQINQLKAYKPSAVTSVYSSDRHLIAQFYNEKRFPVSIENIPDILIQALLTIEDRHFYSHSGLHFKGIARAIVQDIKTGKLKQGASTLTQQLAKTLFLSSEKSFTRKIKEAILTLQIERRYTKNEILELYLNQIYLGAGTYGVEAACQTYFKTSVADINLAQAALIAGLPKAPSTYSPQKNPDLAKKRRDIVLNQLRLTGKITPSEFETALSSPIDQPMTKKKSTNTSYYIEYVKQLLQKKFDLNRIYSQGLNVHTSLNLDFQTAANQAMIQQLKILGSRIQKRGGNPAKLQSAVVAIETKTGKILCMIGGKDFAQSPFNRATQAQRQPGSAFKPFVYATALEKGLSQTDLILDGPLSYQINKNKIWEVNNFSRTYSGEMTFRKALVLSKNTPVVRILEKIGPETVIDFAKKAGISSSISPTLSLALGTYEVNLLEITAAYIPFANMGVKTQPFAIERITDSNSRIIFHNTIKKTAIMSRQNAAMVTDMLKGVILEGTGKRAAIIKKDIAGKTGTTDLSKDALFIGFSPGIALGVWVGNDDAHSLGKNETGARAALPIWVDSMKYFLSTLPPQYFDIPDQTKMVYMNPDTGKITDIKRPGAVKALIRVKGNK